jgi:glycosyltransferase involved in cell wall biosynthesis
MENKFKIITPSYNNEEFVEYNLASILNQTYTNYEVLYINDNSTDNTFSKVESIVGNNPQFKLINRTENKGAAYNYFFELDEYLDNDNDIIVHLDGDDWLFDNNVLKNLNDYYNEKDVWMTYGKFYCYDGTDNLTLGYPQSTPHPDFVLEHKLFRQDTWRASHMRTYRTFLFKKLDTNDLISKLDNKLYWHAVDLAFQYPYLEMCPKNKVGAVDFPTCIYNQAPKNATRTQEREHVDNSKFEEEVRNRKHYKEGLSGEKLPQVNVIGDFRERNSIPKEFSYVYNQLDGEFDITLIQDMDIIRFINGEIPIKRGKIIADIHEAPHLLSQNEVYKAVKDNYTKFDRILTFDPELLKLPNAVFRNGGYEVVLNKNIHKQEYPILQDDSLQQIYTKSKQVSFITSNKVMTEGHRVRLECANAVHSKNYDNVDFYGVGIREIKGKIEGLKDYRFSVAIENGIYDNYFTEKILDCFLTGTVPIYKGCQNIIEFFDTRGFIIFNTSEELVNILDNLTEEDYNSRLEFIKSNFGKAKDYYYNNDILFNKFLKDLIFNNNV